MSTFKLNEAEYQNRFVSVKVNSVIHKELLKLKRQYNIPISSIVRQMIEFAFDNMEECIDRQ